MEDSYWIELLHMQTGLPVGQRTDGDRGHLQTACGYHGKHTQSHPGGAGTGESHTMEGREPVQIQRDGCSNG
jgi:hypothetical protein